MSLHERLEAAIRERLAVAQAATPGPWRVGDWNATYGTAEEEISVIEHAPTLGAFPAVRQRGDELTLVLQLQDGFVDEVQPNLIFITANDPARIIRDCERDLRLLERHVQSPAFTEKPVCRACRRPGYMMAQLWPCPEITDMADAYAIAEEVTSHARQAGPEADAQT
jgi:hypothetical protein